MDVERCSCRFLHHSYTRAPLASKRSVISPSCSLNSRSSKISRAMSCAVMLHRGGLFVRRSERRNAVSAVAVRRLEGPTQAPASFTGAEVRPGRLPSAVMSFAVQSLSLWPRRPRRGPYAVAVRASPTLPGGGAMSSETSCTTTTTDDARTGVSVPQNERGRPPLPLSCPRRVVCGKKGRGGTRRRRRPGRGRRPPFPNATRRGAMSSAIFLHND